MDECELLSFITLIACTIAKSCSEYELALLAAIFTQLGDSLGTVLAQRALHK